ncbi:MAG: flagellar hook-basal body complex protein [Proteobacteria bacterium]|nr:flagellar hook-basal body complex protein [Pseudomonadota bacterium]
MMRALYTAASGMMAQQLNIDNISNNLANVQSVGFKKSRVDFQDLLYAHMQDPNATATGGTQIGMGVRAASTQKNFTQGTVQRTDSPYDLAVQGDGFITVSTPDGEAYTRDGALKYDATKGEIVNAAGFSILAKDSSGKVHYGVKMPNGATNFTVDPDGTMHCTDAKGSDVKIGQLMLTKFLNPNGLKAIGGNLYVNSADMRGVAGSHVVGTPNDKNLGLGGIAQGHLEKSNINVVEEMISIVQAQRAFEMSQKGVQAADEMMRMTNQMQKG